MAHITSLAKICIFPQWILTDSDEELTLDTSALETLYGGQFTLSTLLIKPEYLVKRPADAAPQFL